MHGALCHQGGSRIQRRARLGQRGVGLGRVDGKVALVTGAARGQGRSHCLLLAEEGADIIALDACREIENVPYAQATEEDLAETVRLVEERGRRIVAGKADVRDRLTLGKAVAAGIDALGRVDVLVANAGVITLKPAAALDWEEWDTVVNVNLTGTWNTIRSILPTMLQQGGGGSIIITSSTAGMKGLANLAHYSAAKLGQVGLMRSLAVELGPHHIRVNTVHPTTVDTDMAHWEEAWRIFRPDLENPTKEDVVGPFTSLNALPVPWMQPLDVSRVVLWLASDESRYLTGAAIPVDAGCLAK